MANFTALKTAINNAIKTNGNEEITGAILQAILDAMVETLGDSAINDLENAITTEVTNRENAVGGVAGDLAAEALARANKDNQLDGRINQEEYNRQNADSALSQTMNQGFQTLGSQMNALNAAISALNAAYQDGFLYGGIATPSSSPSNNKCFYIALQGGIYTNFGGVGVVEGINIIKNDSGWKVEHIYDQNTLLNEFYLLRQQVIQAITSFAPIVIEGDVTNAPDEEDLTSNANHLLQFKNNAYSPLEFSGLGRKYLRKNIAPLSESAPFNGFVEGVTAEETLSGTPTQIFWDRMNTRFVGIKDGVYYLDWTDSDNYVPVSTSLVYMHNGTPYQWTGSDFIVDETEVPNLVNCLTQDMINEANTIYIIRYDYTLKEDITIPTNCVLQFDGGSISGAYTITGANTGIQAGLVKIFSTDVTLAGTWDVAAAYPEWFGAKGDGITNDTLAIHKMFTLMKSNVLKVVLFSGNYINKTKVSFGSNLEKVIIKCSGEIINDGCEFAVGYIFNSNVELKFAVKNFSTDNNSIGVKFCGQRSTYNIRFRTIDGSMYGKAVYFVDSNENVITAELFGKSFTSQPADASDATALQELYGYGLVLGYGLNNIIKDCNIFRFITGLQIETTPDRVGHQNEGTLLDNCRVFWCAIGVDLDNGNGNYISNLMTDQCFKTGLRLNNQWSIGVVNSWIGGYMQDNSYGLFITSCHQITVLGVKVPDGSRSVRIQTTKRGLINLHGGYDNSENKATCTIVIGCANLACVQNDGVNYSINDKSSFILGVKNYLYNTLSLYLSNTEYPATDITNSMGMRTLNGSVFGVATNAIEMWTNSSVPTNPLNIQIAPTNTELALNKYNEHSDGKRVYRIETSLLSAPKRGALADKPTTLKDVDEDKGFCYFDTTNNRPIWWTGTNWVDATGATV